MPGGWNAVETLHGRYLFIPTENFNTWDHPDPAFDRALYESRTISECETTYDAFSYTRGSEGPLDSANVVNWSSVSR